MAALKYLILLPIVAATLVRSATVVPKPGIDISSNGEDGKINCDSLICPNATVGCLFTEKNSASNQSVILVTKQCLDSADKVLASENSTFVDATGKIYNTVIYSGSGQYGGMGHYQNNGSGSFNATSIEHELKKFQHEMKKELNETLSKIKKEMENIAKWFK